MFCKIKKKQAVHIEVNDVIEIDGQWRQVWGVYRTTEEMDADGLRALESGTTPFAIKNAKFYGRLADLDGTSYGYVVVWFGLQEKSDAAHSDSDLHMFWTYDLVNVQSIKAENAGI